MRHHAFVGAGWGFPVATDVTGGIALVSGDLEIRQSIRLILATTPGERPMRPEFGCALDEFVFAPADAGTAGQIADEVRRALERWEPRIELDEVDVSVDPTLEGTLLIDVRYRQRDEDDPRNLVFPFYTIPARDRALDGGA